MIDPRVIVIGGSAGALDALLAILPALPVQFAIPVVIVLHLAPNPASLVPELLERATKLHVLEIEDKQPLMRAAIHVAPPNYHVLLERDGTLALSIDEPVHFSRPSIDVMFESAARAFGAGVAGVLLSGANEDGAAGLRRIAEAGGRAFVQDPTTARHAVMPAAAVALLRGRGRIVPARQIAECLAGLDDNPLAERAG
ncbi:MAG TPA: chemotaxis protein CheB [Kofleriaceae bacterium]|jgi:two-component system chemotaxis response regulator CheB